MLRKRSQPWTLFSQGSFKITYVKRHLNIIHSEDTSSHLPSCIFSVTVPSGQSPHHIQCTQSKVYNNVKISGGSKAGDFTDVGKVGRMHICTRLCCEEPACDLAYMVRQSCFLVKCADEAKCRVIGAGMKDKKQNQTTDTSVQYIVKRKYNVQFGKGEFIAYASLYNYSCVSAG